MKRTSMLSRPRYVNRNLIVGPYIGLCLSKAQFDAELKRLNVDKRDWPQESVRAGADASTHWLENPKGVECFLVCIRPGRRPKVELHGLLVHEAVHIWRRWSRSIGETEPSEEFECYAIQGIAQRLMEAYEGR